MPEPSETPSKLEPRSIADQGWVVERLYHGWKIALAVAILGAAAAMVYTWIRPAEYAGHVSIFFPSKPSILGSNALVESSLGGAAAMLSGSSPSSLKVYGAFLSSETAVRDITTATGTKRETFIAKRSLDDDARASVLMVTYNDRDPQHALRVLKAHVDELEKINRKVAFYTSQDDIGVLRKKLEEAQAQLRQAEDDLIRFENTLVSAPTVSSGMGGSITATPQGWAADLIRLRIEKAKVESALASSQRRMRELAGLPRSVSTDLPPVKRFQTQLHDAEYQLAYKRLTLGPDSPEIRKLAKSVETIRIQMERDIRAYLKGLNAGIIDPSVSEGPLSQLLVQKASVNAQIEALHHLAKVAPSESVLLNRRYRQLAIQGAVVQQLTTQLLQVSLQAQRDPNRWVVLDDPWVEEKPSNKSYPRMGLSGFFIGAIVGCLFVILRGRSAP